MSFRLCFPKINISGPGASADVPAELEKRGLKRPLIVTDAMLSKLGVVTPLVEGLKKLGIVPIVFNDVIPNPTVEVVEAGYAMLTACRMLSSSACPMACIG